MDELGKGEIRGDTPASTGEYADPEYYQSFLDELLQQSTKPAMSCDLSIESTSGKL